MIHAYRSVWALAALACATIGALARDEAMIATNDSAIILPDEFGLFNVHDLQGAASCGSVMTTYNGVSAKSNGGNMGTGTSCAGCGSTGCRYQCVEYTQRYFNAKYGTAAVWPVSYAKQMCNSRPSGVSKTSNPQPGDAVVFDWGTYGHTAIITKVSSSSITVIEQNASPSGSNTYNKNQVSCYLTAKKSTGKCPHRGYYCGNDGIGLDANNLYFCDAEGAKPTLSKSCSFTCVIMTKGTDDKCTSGSCSAVNTGYYCGNDKIDGNSHTLYKCVSSKPQGARYCENGCVTAAKGYDDYCK